jgi:cysteine desulfurase/selenocysteine lyase
LDYPKRAGGLPREYLERVTDRTTTWAAPDINEARRLYPATANRVFLNTASVGLGSRRLADVYRTLVDEWVSIGFEFPDAERAANVARSAVARVIGADAHDVALVPAVSSAAGLVAAQFGPASTGDNVVIGEREYSSNNFPWRQLTTKGYAVRQVPFRNGGLDPSDVADHVDGATKLVAFSGVQSATGHRTNVPAISAVARAVGALVFVDGSQLVGALPVAQDLPHIDVLATSDHKFLMHAGRGLGYCYLSRDVQARFNPINAGWRAGRNPMESFFGPEMDLSPTASRFDSSISWVAAHGNEASLAVFDEFGPDAIFRRNAELTDVLRDTLVEIGWEPVDVPAANRSTIVSVPLGDADPDKMLGRIADHDITCSVRDGNLRFSIHFYNHEDDIEQLAAALSAGR